MGIVALDAQRALVATSTAAGDGPRSRVALVDAGRGVLWSAALPLPALEHAGSARVAVHGDQVTVRVSDGRTMAQAVALGLDDGALRWVSEPFGYRSRLYPLPALQAGPVVSEASGEVQLEAFHDGERFVARGLDRRTGVTRWLRPFGSVPSHGRVVDGHLVARFGEVWRAVRLRDGAVVGEAAIGIGTVRGGCVYGVAEGRLGRWSLPGLRAEPLPGAEALEGAPRALGIRGDDLVVTVAAASRATVHGASLATGASRWRFDADPPPGAHDPVGPLHPDLGTMSGDLPRFAGWVGASRLVVVDLDRREVAAVTEPHPNLDRYHWLRAGSVWLVQGHGQVVSIDGATGEVLAAAEVVNGAWVDGHHLAGERIWVRFDGGRPPDAPRWAVLDARTLRVLHASEEGLPVFGSAPPWGPR